MKLTKEQDAVLWHLQKADYLGAGQPLHVLANAVFGWNVWCTKEAVKKALQGLRRSYLAYYVACNRVWAVTDDGREFDCAGAGKVNDSRSMHGRLKKGVK